VRKLKICFVNLSYHPIVGGSEKQAKELAERLPRDKFDVMVITRHFKGLEYFEVINGIRVYRLRNVWRKGLSFITLFIATSYFFLKMHKNIDIIHSHMTNDFAVIGALMGKFFAKPLISKITMLEKEGNISLLKKSLLGNLKYRFILNNIDYFIGQTEEFTQELIRDGIRPKRIKEIPNGVDVNQFKIVSREEKKKQKKAMALSDRRVIVFVGRLEESKGVYLLMEAWKQIVTCCEKVCLVIVGVGSEEKKLKDMMNKEDIRSVIFVGKTERVSQYLQAADIFVLPSIKEGFSNALLEAMASGLPVVATRLGGQAQLVKNGINGILIEPKNVNQIKEAVLNLLRNEGRWQLMGKKARAMVVDNYSLDLCIKRYIQLYNALYNRSEAREGS